MDRTDVVVIGGGIVGVATAMALVRRSPGLKVRVLEAESRLAPHQTGNNSGVIHSGLYYKPGSLKAVLCRSGRDALVAFCRAEGVPFELCGKVVVATHAGEIPALEELERRGQANGLTGLRRIGPPELGDLEPHVVGVAGLHVPETGIVDFRAVVEAMAARVRRAGGEVLTDARVLAVRRHGNELTLETTAGEVTTRSLVNCAGLQCDRVARLCGVEPGISIVPFRGEYYTLAESARHLVHNLVYPVPNPEFPFLGVHFTRRITGEIEAGPNAVLALKREGYTRTSFSPRDAAEILAYPGFWRLARKYLRTGLAEMWRSASKRVFVASLRVLVPEVTSAALARGGAGVRAQALDPTGKLLDDFHIVEAPGSIHVLNAPSPAATASIAIGESIAERAAASFGLPVDAASAAP
jgi:L-2-hydroxyglutarate oxidase